MSKEPVRKKRAAKGPSANVRTEKELAEDLKRICELRKENYGWTTIARIINSERDYELNFTVYYKQYKLAVGKEAEKASADVNELREAEISELQWEIKELQQAWEDSKGVQAKKTSKSGSNDDSETITEWEEYGDPRYMAEIAKRREKLSKLQGLDQAVKVDHTTNGESINTFDPTKYTPEQLKQMALLLSQVKE